MPLPRTMISKVCKACQRTIFVNENGSLYEDVARRHYHTGETCLALQVKRLLARINFVVNTSVQHTSPAPGWVLETLRGENKQAELNGVVW